MIVSLTPGLKNSQMPNATGSSSTSANYSYYTLLQYRTRHNIMPTNNRHLCTNQNWWESASDERIDLGLEDGTPLKVQVETGVEIPVQIYHHKFV